MFLIARKKPLSKKGVSMKFFTKDVPESMIGTIYIAFGLIILLDSMGAINAGILVIIGAIAAITHGFCLMQGPKKIKEMLAKIQFKNNKH